MSTPCYVFDFDKFEKRAQAIKNELTNIPLTYSIKANPFLLGGLPDEIAHVEVCSPGELEICKMLGIPGSSLDQIRTISSHPHAIAQCDAFLAKMKGVQIVPSLNTAISARDVSEKKDPGYAAIASIDAAKEYHLAVLAKDIQTAKQNTTRFFILSMDAQPLDVPDKATVIFRIANVVGALAKVLTSFAQSGLNMTRIESRPIPDRPFQYMFLVDFGGIMDRTQVRQAMEKAKMFTEELRLLGMYPGARLQEAERDDKKSEVLGRNPIA